MTNNKKQMIEKIVEAMVIGTKETYANTYSLEKTLVIYVVTNKRDVKRLIKKYAETTPLIEIKEAGVQYFHEHFKNNTLDVVLEVKSYCFYEAVEWAACELNIKLNEFDFFAGMKPSNDVDYEE